MWELWDHFFGSHVAAQAYAADVVARGGAFIPSLPGNTNLGADALGKPGARFPSNPLNYGTAAGWKPYTYEYATALVFAEAGMNYVADAVNGAQATLYEAVGAVATPVLEATGLDKGVLGVLSLGLGVPSALVLLVLVVAAYLFAQQAGLVPPLNKVFPK